MAHLLKEETKTHVLHATPALLKYNFIVPNVSKFLDSFDAFSFVRLCTRDETKYNYSFLSHLKSITTMTWACKLGFEDIVQLLGDEYLTHAAILAACTNGQYHIVDLMGKYFANFPGMFKHQNDYIFMKLAQHDDADMIALLIHHGGKLNHDFIHLVRNYCSIRTLHYILSHEKDLFTEKDYFRSSERAARVGELNVLQLLTNADRPMMASLVKKIVKIAGEYRQIKAYKYLCNEFALELNFQT